MSVHIDFDIFIENGIAWGNVSGTLDVFSIPHQDDEIQIIDRHKIGASDLPNLSIGTLRVRHAIYYPVRYKAVSEKELTAMIMLEPLVVTTHQAAENVSLHLSQDYDLFVVPHKL